MRDAIVVTGMGRSGTSALTRVLSLCGGAMPLKLLPANFANPTGYWEPERALELNDRFLHAHGSSWYDPELTLQMQPVDHARMDAFVAEIVEFLKSGFENDGPVVLKEPRISGLLPYWKVALRSAGLRAKFVLMFRNPADVAASVAARDGLPLEHAMTLWLKYNLIAERDTRDGPRVFVAYEDLMRDWETVVARCARGLEVDIAIRDDARAPVAEFLLPELHHHRTLEIAEDAVDGTTARYVTAAYALLQHGSCVPPTPSGPEQMAFDNLLGDLWARTVTAHALSETARAAARLETEALEQRIAELSSQLDARNERITELEHRLEAAESYGRELGAVRGAANVGERELRGEIAALHAELSAASDRIAEAVTAGRAHCAEFERTLHDVRLHLEALTATNLRA